MNPNNPIEAAKLSALADSLKSKAADEFFSDPGLPPELGAELREGWSVLEERKKARAAAGVPLLPGGCLILGAKSVVAQCLAEFHNSLAYVLGIEPGAIRLKIADQKVLADISLPEDWPEGAKKFGVWGAEQYGVKRGPEFPRMVESYLRFLIDKMNGIYQENVRSRLVQVSRVRSELVPLDEEGQSWAIRHK